MSDNQPVKSKIELKKISADELSASFDEIESANIAIWRRNIENKLVTIPIKKLQQFLGGHSETVFYIQKDWEERVREVTVHEAPSFSGASEQSPEEVMKQYGDVEKQAEAFQKMTAAEREAVLDESIGVLSNLTGRSLDVKAISNVVDTVAKTFFANNASMEDNIARDDVEKNISGVLSKTYWVLKILIDVFEQVEDLYKEIKILDEVSTGSSTIDHMNRVLLIFVAFSIFYNNYIDSGLITRNIRKDFKDKYLRYYKRRLPDEPISIERVFQDGIRRIDREKEIHDYALGALLYDIGKVTNIAYHDNPINYDENLTKKHSLYGYNMIIKGKKFPFDVLAMAAFHHEYYGGKGSYAFTNPILSKLTGRQRTEENMKFFITYNEQEFKNGTALAFFPCKMLEIVDVYDALVYKKNIQVNEALMTMKKEYITQGIKIDPILFRIFLDFIVKCGFIEKRDFEEIDSIIF